MSKQRHQRREVHAGVDEARPKRVAELVKRDVQRRADRVGEAGVCDSLVESLAEAVLAEASASFAEHEVCKVAVAWVRQRPVRTAVLCPFVEQFDGLGVEGNHPFGAELSEWQQRSVDFRSGGRGARQGRGPALRVGVVDGVQVPGGPQKAA